MQIQTAHITSASTVTLATLSGAKGLQRCTNREALRR